MRFTIKRRSFVMRILNFFNLRFVKKSKPVRCFYFSVISKTNSLWGALPYLQQINKKHLLILVFFQNSELKDLAYSNPLSLNQLYTGIIAERMITIKARMARELKQYGIQTILTSPEELSAGVINKYLELKARGSF